MTHRVALLQCLAVFLLATAVVHCGGARCQSYESAVDYCHSVTKQGLTTSRCAFWSCVNQFCQEDFVSETQYRSCRTARYAPKRTLPYSPLPPAVPLRSTPVGHAQPAASPCGLGNGTMSADQIRHILLDVAMDVYYDRNSEHYTEGPQRWSGIDGHVCPPNAPPYSDCSSMVTWVYWTLFGKGPDFLNNETWSAGYTGTLDKHGTNVTVNVSDLAIGDLCFYYVPMHHVAIYVGGGKVVTHGMDPVGYYAWNYAPVDFCIRYI